MRIDFVITELFVGGAERCLTEVALGLADSGDEVRVFSLGSLPQGEQRLLVGRLAAAGVPVASAGADRFTQAWAARRKLTAWLQQSPPDICQTFLYHANVLGTSAARAAGVGVRVGGVRVAESKQWRTWLERKAIKRMTSVVCVSRAVRRFAIDQLECPESRALVIPNGVDADRFREAPPFCWSQIDWPEDSIVSLFVGRLHPQKGLELIQSQVDQLAPPGSKRRLLVVGDGPLRQRLSRWAQSVGHDRVQLLPWQTNVAGLMKAARLLLLPSRYEGMPNVVMEAMASGRPVVVSRVEGSEELLAHDPEHQSFPPGDATRMASVAEVLLSDERLSDELGRANQQRMQTEFSVAAMVDAYRSHYRMLLSNADTRAQHAPRSSGRP